MNPIERALLATRACYRRQIEFHRDLLLLFVWLVVLVIVGDDAALGLLGLVSGEARASVVALGSGVTTLIFGGVPAVALVVAVLHRDWLDCWRHITREKSSV